MSLAGGAFVASGDLALWAVAGGAFAGAVLGDQAGYQLGRSGGARLVARLERSPARATAIARARGELGRHARTGVFLTRWLLSPLGPYVNLVAGAAGIGRGLFTLWAVLGEAVWVAVYVGLGFAFADRIGLVADIAGNLIGAITAGLKLTGRLERSIDQAGGRLPAGSA